MHTFTEKPLLREEAAAGGEGGAGDQKFDPAAFQTALMSALLPEIDKRVNGLDKRYDKRLKDFEASLKPKERTPEELATEDQQFTAQGEKGKPDLEKQALQKRLDNLQKNFDEEKKLRLEVETRREETERFSNIKTKLAGLGLSGDAALDTAFRIFKDEVKRDPDGNLIAGPDAEPYDKYMDRQIKTVYDFLLPAKNVGGANASRNNGGQAPLLDMDSIKPGMAKADRDKVLAEIARLSAQQ